MCADALVESLGGRRFEAQESGSLANTGLLERIPVLLVLSEFHRTQNFWNQGPGAVK